MSIVLIVLIVAPVLASASPAKIISDTRGEGVRAMVVVGRMNRDHLQRESLRLLAPKNIRVGAVKFYASNADRMRAEGQGGTDCIYENWRAVLRRRGFTTAPMRCPEVAEAIKIEDAILFRSVDAGCRRTQAVVQGNRNPLLLSFLGRELQVLDVIISSWDLSGKQRKRTDISLYVQTRGHVTTELAKRALTYLQSLVETEVQMVILRNDQWFPMDCEFPVYFLFGELPTSIPTKAEYLNSKQAACGAIKPWPIRCN